MAKSRKTDQKLQDKHALEDLVDSTSSAKVKTTEEPGLTWNPFALALAQKKIE